MIGWIKEKILNNKKPVNQIETKVVKAVSVKQEQKIKETKTEDKFAELRRKMDEDIERDTKVRKQAIQWMKEKKFVETIEILDEEIVKRENDFGFCWELYKMKAICLYKTGKGDESWRIYNEMLNFTMNLNIDGNYGVVYFEQGQQLKFEKKYGNALVTHIQSRLFQDRYKVLFDKTSNDFIDYDWDKYKAVNFVTLSKKAKVDWQPIKEYLVEIYKNNLNDLKNPNYIGEIMENINNELIKQGA